MGDLSFNKGSSQRGKTWRVVQKVMVSLQTQGMKGGYKYIHTHCFTITCMLILHIITGSGVSILGESGRVGCQGNTVQ